MVLKLEGLMIKLPLIKGGDVKRKDKQKKNSTIKSPDFQFLLTDSTVIQSSLLLRTCLPLEP